MKKDYVIDFILCLFLGWAGAHKFYNNKIGLGVLYLVTFGLLGVGWLVDSIVLLVRVADGQTKPAKKIESAKFTVTEKTYQPMPTQTTNEAHFVSHQPVLIKEVERQRDYSKKRTFSSSYTVIDFETTGFSADMHEIIEIGAVRFVNGSPADKFGTLIKPSSKIPSKITKITGITNEMVENSPTISEVLDNFIKFIGNDVIVAHNATFDMNFLFASIARNDIPLEISNKVADTVQLARKHFPELPNHKLPTLKEAVGMSGFESHRAVDDCIVTGKIYWECKKRSEIEA